MITHLEHTADAKFEVRGKNIEEVFKECAVALFQVMSDSKVKPELERKITVSAPRLRTLLYEFLEELLVLADTEGFILSNIIDFKMSEDSITCTVLGSNKGYELNTQVKSITYSEMEVSNTKAIVVLDI